MTKVPETKGTQGSKYIKENECGPMCLDVLIIADLDRYFLLFGPNKE